MAKIHLTRGRIMSVTPEECDRIEREWTAKTPKIHIQNLVVKGGEIKSIERDMTGGKIEFDLSNEADKAEIREFEKVINLAKAEYRLKNPLEYYGIPHEEFRSMHPEAPERPGFVFHEILGLVHWSLVEYCLQAKVYGRRIVRGSVSWFIVSNSIDNYITDFTVASAFEAKWRGLKKLNERRNYMQAKSVSTMVAERQGTLGMSMAELPIISVDDDIEKRIF